MYYTFGLLDCIRYNEDFVISRLFSLHFTATLVGLKNIDFKIKTIISASLRFLQIVLYQTFHTALDCFLDHFKSKIVKMQYYDVIFDDVTKTWFTHFLISNHHQIHHSKEHDWGSIILKTILRYDKYFSNKSNLKKFHFPPKEYCSSKFKSLDLFSFSFLSGAENSYVNIKY